MFTGIIEEVGQISRLEEKSGNLELTIRARFSPELEIDQSVAHNGACLTVIRKTDKDYTVSAVSETLSRTNLSDLKEGDPVNLERGIKMDARLDGHIVQGHVDQTGICTKIEKQEGSQIFHFEYDQSKCNVTIEKGSITVNGVSLTVVDSGKHSFCVAVIPYTLEHTSFKVLKQGDTVNLEFDVIGKYVKRLMDFRA